MSWMLLVPTDSPQWLRRARLCYSWYPDGDGGQCGGGVGRELCATANHWTTYYRDDTDGRGGGSVYTMPSVLLYLHPVCGFSIVLYLTRNGKFCELCMVHFIS